MPGEKALSGWANTYTMQVLTVNASNAQISDLCL